MKLWTILALLCVVYLAAFIAGFFVLLDILR